MNNKLVSLRLDSMILKARLITTTGIAESQNPLEPIDQTE